MIYVILHIFSFTGFDHLDGQQLRGKNRITIHENDFNYIIG